MQSRISFAEPRVSPHRQIPPVRRAGTPAQSANGATSRVTTVPAATNAYSPIVTPLTIVALAPMVAPRPTTVGSIMALRLTDARGVPTFVNTAEGPTNTSGSSVT